MNLLDIVYEHQALLHRKQSMDIPLDESENARLLGLDRLLKGEYLGVARPTLATMLHPIPAQFTRSGGFGAGEIRSVSSNGMAVVTAHPCDVGQRTIVRIADPLAGVEYVFPGKVIWVHDNVMGVGFDGLPTKAPFLLPTRSGWRRGVRFGGETETICA